MKKALRISLVLVIALVMLAGCNTPSYAPDTSTPAAPAGNSPAAPAGNSPSAPAGNAPSGGNDPAAAPPDPVRIGVLLPLSGVTSYYGEIQLQGIQHCVDYVNSIGGIQALGGAPIELVVQDSASDPETGVSAFELLIESGVTAVVGPYNSTVAAATAPLAIQYRVPYVIVNATSENYMSVENKYVYRTNTGSTDGDGMWALIIQYLNRIRPQDPTDIVAIVYDSGDWGTAAVGTWRSNAEAMGYTLAVDEAVSETSTDLSTLVNKIRREDVDLVIVAAFSSATNLLVRQMEEYEVKAKVAGLGGGIGDIEFINNCGSAANGALYSAPWVPSHGGGKPEAVEWNQKYFDAYGVNMTMEPCWGWLGVGTLINAIEIAGSADREAVADALYNIKLDKDNFAMWFSGYDGVEFDTAGKRDDRFPGGIRYNNNKLLGETTGMVLTQVQNGQWVIVFPTSYNNGRDIIDY